MPKTVRIAVSGCWHCPLVDMSAFDWHLGVVHDFKPDYYLMNGDGLDGAAFTSHPSEVRHTWLDELESFAECLQRVESVIPKDAKRLWNLGNHEYRAVKKAGTISPELRDSLDWNRSEYGEVFRRWTQRPYRKHPDGVVQIGQILACHGFDCGVNSDKTEAFQINSMCGGYGHTLNIRSHTHRVVDVQQARLNAKTPSSQWFANTGTLCDMRQMHYAHTRYTSEWGPGVVLVEARIGRACQPGKNWDAVTVRPSGKETSISAYRV